MEDEYRIEVDLDDVAHGHPLSERLRALDLDDEVEQRLGERVIVTRDGPKLFVYTASTEAAKEAEGVVRAALSEEGLTASLRRRRWNPVDRFWQDADEPVPEGEEASSDHLRRAREEGVPHPLFVYLESHEPEFMRDLGI